jgi:hypothetical protein
LQKQNQRVFDKMCNQLEEKWDVNNIQDLPQEDIIGKNTHFLVLVLPQKFT